MPKFITLTDIYEQIMGKNSSVQSESLDGVKPDGVLSLKVMGNLDIFINENDIKNNEHFLTIMKMQNKDERFNELLKLSIDIMKDRLQKCKTMCSEMWGVELNIQISNTDIQDIKMYRDPLYNVIATFDSENSEDTLIP